MFRCEAQGVGVRRLAGCSASWELGIANSELGIRNSPFAICKEELMTDKVTNPTGNRPRIRGFEPEAIRRAKRILTRAALDLPPPTRELDSPPDDGDAPPGILTPLVKEWSAALAEEEPFPSVAQVASLLPELAGRPVPPHWEEIMHQLDWQCAELLGNWEELVLLMGHVARQVETISDWWELRHAWRLHTGIVAAAAYRIGLRMGRKNGPAAE